MCFGNDSPPPVTQLGAPPPPPEIMDVIDEVTGTQALVVTDANGKKRRVISRLPRTPEEEQRYKLGEELISKSIQNIRELYRYDPKSVVDFAPIIETFSNLNKERMESLGQIANIGNIQEDVEEFKQMQRSLLDEEFNRIRRESNENLIHGGISDSTSANEFRASLAKNEAMARREADVQASIHGEDLAARRLNRNIRAYGLQEMGREARQNSANTEYALRKEHQGELERRRLQAIEENRGLLGVGSNLVGQDTAKALASQAPQLADDTFRMQSADSLARYNADVNRQMANHNMVLNDYNSRPQSFGDFALQAGGALGGAMLTAAPNTFAGRLGSKIF